MKIRPATADDVPAVARLGLAALSDESPWRSFFPSKCQHAPEYVEYGEATLRSYLEPGSGDGWLFLVLELSEAESRTRSGPLIVSAAVLDTRAVDSRGFTPRNSSDRLHDHATATIGNALHWPDDHVVSDAPGKLAALSVARSKGCETRFGDIGDPYLYLHMLATRPDYQRRGYGKALAAYAVDVARRKHMPVCVQAGSRGYILFSGLGFADLGPVLLPADKGGDELVLKALMLDSSRAQRRGSVIDALLRYISH